MMDGKDKPLLSSAFDPSLYPRSYFVRPGWRIFLYAFGLIALGGGAAGVIWYVSGAHSQQHDAAIMAVIALCFAGFGAYAIADTRRSKIVLLADALERHELRGMRSLQRSQIAGYRLLKDQHGIGYIVLEPRAEPGLKKLKIPTILKRDLAFQAWFDTLPNLDAVELRAAEAEIIADPSLGATPEQRMGRLKLARRAATALNGGSFALVFWALVYPHPYLFLIGLLLFAPWLAVGLTAWKPQLFSLNTRQGQAKAGLAGACLGPPSALALRALNDVKLLDWHSNLTLSLVGAALIGGLMLAIDPELRRRKLDAVTIVFLAAMHGYGAGSELDMLPDRAAPQVFRAAIENKHVTRGKYTSWYLHLAPWGPRTAAEDVRVSREDYAVLRPGDTACVSLHPGTIGIPWYQVHGCPASPDMQHSIAAPAPPPGS